MKQGLHTRQSQNMVMTPQLTESIKILQLASAELIPYIETEMEQNPFLEPDDGGDKTPDNNSEESPNNLELSENENSLPENINKINTVDKAPSNWNDDEVSPAVYGNESLIYSGAGSGRSYDSGGESMFENIAAESITLREHIIGQINADVKDPVERLIALHISDHLDDSGYILQDLTVLCETLKCSMEELESVLENLQRLDPPGVFARNLSECLKLQLRDRNRLDPAMLALVNNLDLMAKCDFKALKKICGVDEEDLKEMCAEIRALDPKPGNNFSSENVQVLIPDVFLKQDSKSNWILELNSEALPKVLVNRNYYSKIDGQVTDGEAKKFLTQKWNTANWLAKALDQRANTILKVATEIVMQQGEFFRKGIHHLKPMVIADVAQKVEAHESTVSRVINGKYIATHMGTYELKYFFSSGIGSSDGGEDVSSKSIKYMIKNLIDAENKDSILSDDKIAIILKDQGIDVARRTIMKYRESMSIPSSPQRRREKVLA